MKYPQTQLVALNDDMIKNIRSFLRILSKDGVRNPHHSDIIRKKNFRGRFFNTETKIEQSLYQVSLRVGIPCLLSGMSYFVEKYDKQLGDEWHDYMTNCEYKYVYLKFIKHTTYYFSKFHRTVEVINREGDIVMDYMSIQIFLDVFFQDGGVFTTIRNHPPTR